MRVTVRIEADRAPAMFQLRDRLHDRRPLAEGEKPRHVRHFRRPRRMSDFDDASFLSIVDDGGGEDGGFVCGKRRIRPGHKPRQRRQRRDDHPPAKLKLLRFPRFNQR